MQAQLDTQKPSLGEVSDLLRGDTTTICAWNERKSLRRLLLQIAIIVLGAGCYGAAMGSWRGAHQALYTAIKFPLIILLTTFGNALINGMLAPLLGLSLPFYRSVSAIIMSFTITSAIFCAFSPLIGFMVWNTPALGARGGRESVAYSAILLAHVCIIAFAGAVGNQRLFQLLANTSGSRAVASRVLVAWLAVNFFMGTQLSWIFRPFIGSPYLPVEFLRQDAFHGNFYETVLQNLKHLL